MTRPVKCPCCGKPTLFTNANPARPFCSERCKLIDLGQWADEKYVVPVKPATEAEAEQSLAEYQQTFTRKGAASGENPSMH